MAPIPPASSAPVLRAFLRVSLVMISPGWLLLIQFIYYREEHEKHEIIPLKEFCFVFFVAEKPFLK
jgi:hypothetical protein